MHFGTPRTKSYQTMYTAFVGTDQQEALDSDMGLREAANRLRERLVATEEAEVRAHERAAALRIALQEVETLITPVADTTTEPGQEGRDLATVPSPERVVRPQATPSGMLRHTVASVIRDILTNDPRPWNATEIIAAVGRSDGAADLRNPSMAVRAALRRMVERGEIRRVGRGMYQAVVPSPRPERSVEADLADSPLFGPFVPTTVDPKEDAPWTP